MADNEQMAKAFERYVVGGPRDGNTALIVGETLFIPATPGNPQHRYRAAHLKFPNYGFMSLLISEDLTNEQARAIVFRRVLGGFPGVQWVSDVYCCEGDK